MIKGSVDRINQTKSISSDLEIFTSRIKEEIVKIEVRNMNKKNPIDMNLLDFIGFIDTEEETDCVKDHGIIF